MRLAALLEFTARPVTLAAMRAYFIPAILILLIGCATPQDEQIIPFTQQQARALFRNARPPQAFGLTVYNTERGPVFAGSHRVHAGHVAQMPFLNKSDERAPVIGVTARGVKDIHALIDTASRENWIVPGLANDIAIVPLAGPNPYEEKAAHVYDDIGGYAGLLHKLMLDKLHVENVVFYIRGATGPMGPPARWLQNPAPQAVLGAPFLRAFSFVTLDFLNRSALFAATTPYPGADEDLLIARVPLLDIRGVLAVEGALSGEPTTFILDTGGDFDLALNEPKEQTIRRLSVGDLVFPPEAIVKSARDIGLGEIEYPRIGRGLLARYKVTFDFRSRAVWFERPAPPIR